MRGERAPAPTHPSMITLSMPFAPLPLLFFPCASSKRLFPPRGTDRDWRGPTGTRGLAATPWAGRPWRGSRRSGDWLACSRQQAAGSSPTHVSHSGRSSLFLLTRALSKVVAPWEGPAARPGPVTAQSGRRTNDCHRRGSHRQSPHVRRLLACSKQRNDAKKNRASDARINMERVLLCGSRAVRVGAHSRHENTHTHTHTHFFAHTRTRTHTHTHANAHPLKHYGRDESRIERTIVALIQRLGEQTGGCGLFRFVRHKWCRARGRGSAAEGCAPCGCFRSLFCCRYIKSIVRFHHYCVPLPLSFEFFFSFVAIHDAFLLRPPSGHRHRRRCCGRRPQEEGSHQPQRCVGCRAC